MIKPETKSLIYHGVIVFTHVLTSATEWTFKEAADEISKHYDKNNLKTAAVLEALRSCEGKIQAEDMYRSSWKVIFDADD